MENQFIKAVDEAIKQVIRDFQGDPNRYWNEREIHWSLFHHLKNQAVFRQSYATEIIRAEFPTRRKYEENSGARKARGHYDLVVLGPDSLNTPAMCAITPWTPWDECLPLMEVLVAVEVKVWWYRWKPIKRRVEWDIKKLTDSENAVKHPYFLNFVGCGLQRMNKYYVELRECLAGEKRQNPQLKILCAPSDPELRPQGDYWISVPK